MYKTTRILGLGLALICPVRSLAESPPRQAQILHTERSLYLDISIVQRPGDGLRCMEFRLPQAQLHNGEQSCQYVSDPTRIALLYPQLMMAGLYLAPEPKRILIIGLGGGTIASAMQQLIPDAQIDAVEIDDAVVRMAKQYFQFVPGAKTHVTISDGRIFVKRAIRDNRHYYLVFLDSYRGAYIPEHMTTQEFLREVSDVLAPGGVVVSNTWSQSKLYDSESVTYASVFGPFMNLRSDNRIIVARKGGLLAGDTIRLNAARWEKPLSTIGVHAYTIFPLLNPDLRSDVDWNRKAPILTDQFSPANLLNGPSR